MEWEGAGAAGAGLGPRSPDRRRTPSEDGCVRRRASAGCPGSARSEGTAGGADSGCEPVAEELKARGRGRGVVWPGRSQGGPLPRVRGRFQLWWSGRPVSPLFPRGQIISPEGPGLWSLTLPHCADSQADWTLLWLATPTPCKPPADRAGRGLQGPEPTRAQRWGEAGVPAFCRSLGTRVPNG